MIVLLIGAGVLGTVLGLFYLKDRLESPTLARLAYSELTMRIAVIGAALIAVGLLMMLSEAFSG